MTDLNKVNFMSKSRFDNLSVTNDDELYIVETTVALDEDVVHKSGVETISNDKTFTKKILLKGSNSQPSGFLYQGGDTGNLYLGLQDSSGNFSNNVLTLFKNGNSDIKAALSVSLLGTTPAVTNVQPTEDTTNSTQIDTVGARNTKLQSYSLDTSVVHKSGAESIAGNKTFSDNLTVTGTTTLNNSLTVNNIETINGNLNIYTATASTQTGTSLAIYNINTAGNSYAFRDIIGMGSDNVRIGGVRFYHAENDVHKMTIYTANGSNNYATDLSVCYDNTNSIGYITTNTKPDASSSTSSFTIPTIGWVNDPTTATNVVHRTGNESIAGTKTFLTNTYMQGADDMTYSIKLLSADNTLETNVRNSEANFRAFDKNNKIIGDLRVYKFTNGNSTTQLLARNYANTQEEYGVNGSISVTVTSDGEIYTSAPTPPTADNSTQIATTAYVNSKLSSLNTLGFPNYSSKTTLTWNLNYTATSNGWLIAYADAANSGTFSVEVYIDNCQIAQAKNAASYSYGFSIMAPVKKGSKITSTGNARNNAAYFVPCI